MSKEDNFFGDIVGGVEDTSSKLNREVLEHLFPKEHEKLLMISDLSEGDLVWVTCLVAELRFLVDDFITDRKLKKNCYRFIEDVIKMRISLQRKGRTELFDALKSQTTYEMAKEGGLASRIKGRLSPI